MIFLQYDHLRPIYFLVRWQFYEKERYQLRDKEIQDAKIFFNAMQRLPADHKKLLSDVYYKSPYLANYDPKRGMNTTVKPIKDKEMCKKYGMTLDNFRNRRRIAQYHLKLEMQRVLQSTETIFMLRVNRHLYLTDYGNNSGQYVLGDISEAKIFNQTEENKEEFYQLLLLGFEKMPILSNQIF
ncbi:MAG: hypothetical protein ACLTFU_15120 [Enterococcus avium]